MPHSPTRIVACVDTGVDDAMALAYLLASPHDCELLGVLAGYGNVDAPTAERNTRLVLDLFGRSDIPVFRSSTHPSWADTFIPDAGCAQFHGPDGLGGAVADGLIANAGTVDGIAADGGDASAGIAGTPIGDDAGVVSVGGYPLGDRHANPAYGYGRIRAYGAAQSEHDASAGTSSPPDAGVDFLIDAVREYGRDVTVLATGPLTDVDAAISHAPGIASMLHVVMMGGALTQPGNCWDAVTETNVIQDPEAADRVFRSGADVTMVGLDVTHQCLLPRAAAGRWRAAGTDRGRFLARLADFSITANLEADPVIFAGGMPLHDPLAAAVALDPSLVSCFDVALRAETATGDFTGVRGRTTGDPAGLVTPSSPRVHVALGVDAARFVGGFTDRLAALCAA